MALPKPQLNGDVLAYDELQTEILNESSVYQIREGWLIEYLANGYKKMDIRLNSTASAGVYIIPLPTNVVTDKAVVQIGLVLNTRNLTSSFAFLNTTTLRVYLTLANTGTAHTIQQDMAISIVTPPQ